MNIGRLIIMTMCVISPIAAYAMQERQGIIPYLRDRAVLEQRLQALRAQSSRTLIIINGVLYENPQSPEAVAAREAWRQRRAETERRRREAARQRERERQLRALLQERAAIALRALRSRSVNIPLNTPRDTRTRLSQYTSNKENRS